MMRAVLAVIVLASACMKAPASAPPAEETLRGTRWILAGAGADGPTLEFAQDRAIGYAGCNRYFAQVRSEGAALAFEHVGATRRLCSAPVMQVEQSFLAVLAQARGSRLEDGALVLVDANGGELARFARR